MTSVFSCGARLCRAPHEKSKVRGRRSRPRTPTKCTCSTKLNIIRAACLIGYCDTAYFAASFLTVVTFRIVEGTPTVFANRVPVNSGESLSRMRQSQ